MPRMNIVWPPNGVTPEVNNNDNAKLPSHRVQQQPFTGSYAFTLRLYRLKTSGTQPTVQVHPLRTPDSNAPSSQNIVKNAAPPPPPTKPTIPRKPQLTAAQLNNLRKKDVGDNIQRLKVGHFCTGVFGLDG